MNLAETFTYNTVYRILNMAVVYAIVVLVSRLAGVEGYGLISLMIVNASLFNLATAFGADAGIAYYSAGAVLQPGKIISIIFIVILVQLILIVVFEGIFYSVTGHYWILQNNMAHYWWIGVLFVLSITITDKYTALFNGHYLFILCSKLLLASNLLIMLFFFILIIWRPAYDFIFVIAAYVLLYFLQSVVLVAAFHIRIKKTLKLSLVNSKEIKAFLSFSVITLVTNIIQFLAYRADYWFIDHYRGSKELGWYSLAVRLVQAFWVLPLIFASVLFPQVAKEKVNYDINKIHAFCRILFSFNIITGVMLFFIAGWFIPYLFGNKYTESALLFQILLPGVILFCQTTILASYFAGQGLLTINLMGSALCFICIIVLDVLLIPDFGMKGAALASSIGYGITTGYFIFVYCRQTNTGIHQLFYIRQSDWNFVRAAFYKTIEKKA